MLNYIIPPIVIVLSLAALITFLFKKSAKIPEELILQEKRREGTGIETDKKKLFRFSQLILKITEKTMQYFKLFSLRFYNKTDNWFHSIKEKREKRLNAVKDEKAETENDLLEFSQGRFAIRRKKEMRVDNVIVRKEFSGVNDLEEDVEIEPMISKEVVHPDSKINVRNEFEKALIERIALNPRDVEAYERLGDYYIEIGNFNDSLACFEEVLKLSPINRKAKIKAKRLQKIVFGGLSK